MKKQILILGGTMFVGRMVVEKLQQLPQYEVTLFNRGKSNAGLFPDVKQLHGNRETEDVQQITAQQWDCIIDFSGYYPLTFQKLLHDLKGKVKRYIFISTISVYDLEKYADSIIKENGEIHSCTEEQKTSKLPDAYGEKKAEMERILLQQDWLDSIILRPSFIYGAYDWTERFYYWLYRAKFFDRVLMPQNFGLSLTYAGDLASAIVNAIEADKHQKVYNVISQPTTSLREVVNMAASQLGRNVDFVDADNALLEKNGVDEGAFPLYVPLNFVVEGTNWLKDFSVAATPFDAAIKATLEYHDGIGWQEPKAGLKPEKEKEISGV